MRFILAAAMLSALSGTALAGPVYSSGVFTSDGDVSQVPITVATNGTISIRTYGYGGLLGQYTPGGFAPSLSLYDSLGNQVARDFTGGTYLGGGTCSNGATPDPTTNFCEDATIAFNAQPGSYLLILSVQGNDGPDPLSNGYLLTPGQNLPGGPFLDPGDGTTERNGNWALSVDLPSGGTSVPEPSSWLPVGIVTLFLFGARRRSRRAGEKRENA